MMSTIDIAVVIPSFNRGNAIRENIEKLLSLEPGPREIILVDDHSDAGSEKILRDLAGAHPQVIYIRLPENGGQSVARSVGLATASCKYIVSLDDDSWFLDGDGLKRVWDRMESFPNCGILAFETYAPVRAIEAAKDELLLVSDHITCGAAYRTGVLRGVGYHLGFLRYEGEESDLSLKVMGAGHDIVLDRNIRVFHDYDPSKRETRVLKRVRKYGVRNDLLRSLIYFPFPLNLVLLAKRWMSHFTFGIKQGYLGPTMSGYAGFIRLLPRALQERNPISASAAKLYLQRRRKPEYLAQGQQSSAENA